MFTGIIEEVGRIKAISRQGKDYQLDIDAKRVLEDVQLGDSISVNGVCLTVVSYTKDWFKVDVMPETLKATSLATLQVGSKVNLERAMLAGGRFGGHIVSGHVDHIGHVTEKRPVANATYFRIRPAAPDALRYIIPKGSICIDGISLTVVDVDLESFTVSIIPHTSAGTNLYDRQVGDIVNLEVDILAKYMEKLLENRMTHAPNQRYHTLTAVLQQQGYME